MIDEKRDDGIDNDGDWNAEYDDVGVDGIPDTHDFGEADGVPTPGEPNFDRTDVDESDQIGLTSFDYFTPAGEFPMRFDEQLWEKMHPGFFDTPSSIQDGQPIAGEDGDFIYGSVYFPLLAGKTERFSLALVYGRDLEELINNKRTVQNIYNNNYRFPPPPLKPTLTAKADSGEVTLYWDRVSETSIDPITKRKDFQGYKLYRATDANFNDVRNITNAHGIIEGYSPIAQFDLNDDYPAYFYPSDLLFQEAQGYSYYLGDNTGLQHSYVDRDVQNGRTYYYALVAYDSGERDKDIFPAENTKFISVLPSGEIITDKNTAVITPSYKSSGYAFNDTIPVTTVSSIATGSFTVEIVDDQALTGNTYEVTFLDQSTDAVDNDGDWDPNLHDVGRDGVAGTNDADGTELNGTPDPGEPNLDRLDRDEYVSLTTYYSVRNLDKISYDFTANDTLIIGIPYENLIPGSISITNDIGLVIAPDDYIVDTELGRIRGAFPDALGKDDYTIEFEYYPISNSPYLHKSTWTNADKTPYVPETLDSEVFDGVRINFNNDWSINTIDSLSFWWTNEFGTGWEKNNPDSTYLFSVSTQNLFNNTIIATKMPSDYMVVFSNEPDFGQSYNLWTYLFTQMLDSTDGANTNFKIIDRTNNVEVPYLFYDEYEISVKGREGIIDPLDIIYFFENDTAGNPIYTWSVIFTLRQSHHDSLELDFSSGDTLFIAKTKSFRQGDSYTFITPKPTAEVEDTRVWKNQVRVVPNPYYSAHEFEAPLPPGITSGRGTRNIYFNNVPSDARVHIFTARGQHLKTIDATNDIHDGTLVWNLKTKENLDIAYGVYFYIVDSPAGGKQSGKFAVIK